MLIPAAISRSKRTPTATSKRKSGIHSQSAKRSVRSAVKLFASIETEYIRCHGPQCPTDPAFEVKYC